MREGQYRISLGDNQALSSSVVPQHEITILRAENKELEIYEVNETAPWIEESSAKQKYLQFKAIGKKKFGSELNLKSIILTNAVVDRLKDSLILKDKKEVIRLLNSSKSEDWKKLIFGEKSDEKLRFAGLAELKRRWEDVSEHTEIMLKDDYLDVPFEKKYFIPTGFIDVGNGQYLRIEELLDDSVKINLQEAKVKILKDVILYHVEEVSKAGVSKDFQKEFDEVLGIFKCGQSCKFNAGAEVGNLLGSIIDIFQGNDNVGAQMQVLKKSFESLCGKINSQVSISSEKIKLFNSLALYYPNIHTDDYIQLNDLGFTPHQAVFYLNSFNNKRRVFNPEDALSFNKKFGSIVESVARLNLSEQTIPFLVKEYEKNKQASPSAEVLYEMIYGDKNWKLNTIAQLGEAIRAQKGLHKLKNLKLDDIYLHFSHIELPDTADSEKFLNAELESFIKKASK